MTPSHYEISEWIGRCHDRLRSYRMVSFIRHDLLYFLASMLRQPFRIYGIVQYCFISWGLWEDTGAYSWYQEYSNRVRNEQKKRSTDRHQLCPTKQKGIMIHCRGPDCGFSVLLPNIGHLCSGHWQKPAVEQRQTVQGLLGQILTSRDVLRICFVGRVTLLLPFLQ